MNNLFSAISGHFGKALILGTLFPVAVALILGIALLGPYVPAQHSLLTLLQGIEKEWQAIVLTGAAVVMSGFLYNLNVPIIRFYEGYYWKRTWIGTLWIRNFQEEFDLLSARRTHLLQLLSRISGRTPEHALETPLRMRLARVAESLKRDYPISRDSILPTRLGNTIRSFENYPRHQYGISAVPVWPRLQAIIAKDYAAMVDDSKTSLDFLINSSLLSIVLAISLLVSGAASPLAHVSWRSEAFWISQVLILIGLSYSFYRLAISQAVAWGDMVKGAFDLYRWDLLKQMGYQQVPITREEERTLWGKISRQLLFGDKVDTPWLDSYAPPPEPREKGHGWTLCWRRGSTSKNT